jgi:hypothetical protein
MKPMIKTSKRNLEGRDHSEDLGVDGRIILEMFLEKQVGESWTLVNTVTNVEVS